MPLSFQTLHHGPVAFGFFNIESDMLLQQYFFFADAFCGYISSCADHETWNPVGELEIYEIANPGDVGDLMGAIHGIRHTGFIGETYETTCVWGETVWPEYGCGDISSWRLFCRFF